MIQPSQVGSDPFLRSGQMSFTLKVTAKLFWAVRELSPCFGACQGAGAVQQNQLKGFWAPKEKLGLFFFHRVPPCFISGSGLPELHFPGR